MRFLFTLILLLEAGRYCSVVDSAALAVERPNVILILADDMAVGDISAFNNGITRTPNIDGLMQGGLFFSQAYSASAVCAPARAALLTGRYPHRTGVVSLDMNTEPQLTRLHHDETTIADLFSSAGYHTGLVGKWHTGLGTGYGPLARGFQEFHGFHGSDKTAYFHYAIRSDDAMQAKAEPQDVYLTDALSAQAIRFVHRNASKPFFLHLAHYAPHRPLQAPADSVQPYLEAGFDAETATVYAMIEIMDRGIGALLRELEALGIRQQTLILFASDNGPDSLVPPRYNQQLRGTKYTVHEGGIRVPFIVNWPGTVQPGQRDELIHFTDVLPTLADVCSLDVLPKLPLDGRSFAPLLRGEAIDVASPRFWQWNRSRPNYTHNAAMRDGPWKLVKPFVTKSEIDGDSALLPALYHLAEDPQETTDLATQYPDRLQTMLNALDQWSREVEQDRTLEQ